jgi:hypothetical protein
VKPGRPPSLTAAQQFLNLRGDPAVPGQGCLRPGGLTWRCDLQPTPLSRVYSVRIEYLQGTTPRVFVDSPNLEELAQGRHLPHVYREPEIHLCLFMPAREQWHGGLLISRTIVQWTMLWLYFFEEWLASGDWKGGGEHPPPRIEKPKLRRGRRSRASGHASPNPFKHSIEAA